jgi:hypothetical protein
MTRPLYPLFIALLASLGASGCAGVDGSSQASQSLADLPNCSMVEIDRDYQAEPADTAGQGDELYVVRQAGVPVCATNFRGLEQLADRLDRSTSTVLRVAYSSSDPVFDPLEDPAASNPMPGHGGGDPAASNPMPGHGGGDPASSNPMPGKDGRLAMISSAAP